MYFYHFQLPIVFSFLFSSATAAIPCETDDDCQATYKMTSTVCLQETKTCSNPFQQGCLLSLHEIGMGPVWEKKRVCNSDDLRTILNDGTIVEREQPTYCNISDFQLEYPEIRIHNGNWESSVIMSWIYQIVLSELVQVPATVGLSSLDTPIASFYSEKNDFVFSSKAYPYYALNRANEVGGEKWPDTNERPRRQDCSSTIDPCVDVLPEVWQGQFSDFFPLIANRTVEPPSANGLLGRSGLFIPARTAKQFPQFSIWFGLAGEDNRQILAETFLRPLSWLEYCQQVSPSNCTESSDVAARFPNASESDMYFHEGDLYTGYFTSSGTNNCTEFPTNCTGHIVTPPCTWSSPIDAQLYWNNIVGLSREGGPLSPVSGYSQEQMIQIYKAANATGNNVIMHWYEPEPTIIEFHGTDYEFIAVTLPSPTSGCIENRVDAQARCSASIEARRGKNSIGSCGDDIEPLQRLIAKIVPEDTYQATEVDMSPAYEFIKTIQVSNLDMTAIIHNWKNQQIDPMGNDLRTAVCEWIAGNLPEIKGMIPNGFPRERADESVSSYKDWYVLTALSIGSIVAAIAFVGLLAVFRFRKTKVMIFAQPIFMQLILIGFVSVSVGGTLYATEPTNRRCVSSMWLLLLGYTIEMVPVLVKTLKINQMVRSFNKTQKRIQISRQRMLCEVALVVAAVVAFLTSWTVKDPPERTETRFLSTAPGEATVQYDIRCSSNEDTWLLIAYAWQAILLILAAFLAFQSRDVISQLNESKSLAVMVYSHFLFVCLRGVFSVFYVQETFSSNITATLMSLAYSLDALSAMVIYVFPKLLAARNAPDPYRPGLLSSSMIKAESTRVDDQEEDDEDGFVSNGDGRAVFEKSSKPLTILVCSANMGNQEPTSESLEAWIPLGGNCSNTKPFDANSSCQVLNSSQTFGLIAIGMQEATWTAASNLRDSKSERKELTEEEAMNALEEANTVQLREMIQEILGDDYFQIADEQRGQMRLHLWVKRRVAKLVKEVKISGANTGIGNVLANKGGIVATIYLRKTRISFVSAHLAAHEGDSYYKMRCENIRSILREAKTFDLSGKLDVATSSHHTFFLGDLNFRSRFENDKTHEENVATAKEIIASGDLATLYALDELQQGLEKDFLVGFKTLPCPFEPTFKVERQLGFVYKGQRTPSWTDRILFHSSSGLDEWLRPLSYEACSDYITSDHKPIRGAFSVISNEDLDTFHVDGEMTFDFHKIRCSDLPAVNANGKSDPYIMIMWDSVPFYSDAPPALDFLRTVWFGDSWPKTSFIQKTLDPYWKGQKIVLKLKNATIAADGMIFVTVLNYDKVLGRNDLLGAAVLNVKDLITESMVIPPTASPDGLMEERSVPVERRLVRDGKDAGEIKLKVTIKRKRVHAQERQRRQSGLRNALQGMKQHRKASTKVIDREYGSDSFQTNPPARAEDVRV